MLTSKLRPEDVYVSIFSGATLTACTGREISLERAVESGIERIVSELCHAAREDKPRSQVIDDLMDCVEVWAAEEVSDFVKEHNQTITGLTEALGAA